MRSLAHILSIFNLIALPLVAVSLPNPPCPTPRFSDISHQLENRAYFKDVSQFNFAPFNVTELRILCERLNTTLDYSCNLTCKLRRTHYLSHPPETARLKTKRPAN
jgi:hypothetical protein